MGLSKRRKAQISKRSDTILPFNIGNIDFIDALIKENCVDLNNETLFSRVFFKSLLEKYFKVDFRRKQCIANIRFEFITFLRKESTIQLFFDRLQFINGERQIIEPEITHSAEKTPRKEELTHNFALNSPDTPQIKELSEILSQYDIEILKAERRPFTLQLEDSDNEEIEALVNTMSPISISNIKEKVQISQNPCVKRLTMDAYQQTSPIKNSDTSEIKERKGIDQLLNKLTQDQLLAIQGIMQLFVSQNSLNSDEQLPVTSQEMIFESTETETKLIFSNKEVLDESENELIEQNPENVIQVSEDTTLRIYKRSDTNNFYCLESKLYEKECFWVSKHMEFSLCVRTQEVVSDIYSAKKIMAKGLSEKGITCEFVSEKSILNATALTFSSNGYCHHRDDGCTIKYRMHTTKGGPEGRHLLLFLNSSVPVDHSEMKVRFPQYRGKTRDDLKKNFTTPELMLRKLGDIDFIAANKGNLQGLTTRNVLQTISSEIQKSNSMIDCELNKLMVCIQCGETEAYGVLIVQRDSFQIIMIDDHIYDVLKNIPAKSVTMQIDATGQLVKFLQCCRKIQLHGSKKTVLVHANVVKLNEETLILASMVSDSQNALTLGTYHSYFLTQMMLRINKSIIKRIVSDWSVANFIAVLRTYNNMTVPEYLNFMYDILADGKIADYHVTFIFLIICYSHFMKLISGFSKREISKSVDAYKEKGYPKKQKQLLMAFFAVIRASKTLEEIEVFFKSMCKVFCNKFLTSEVQLILSKLKEMKIDEIDEERICANDTDEEKKHLEQYLDEQFENICSTGGKTIRGQVKWYHRFKKIYDDLVSKIDNDASDDKILNPYHVPGIMLRSIELYFTYVPIWSRIGHALDETEDDQTFTNGLIESLFKYLKHSMKGPLRKRPTEFLRSMHSLVRFQRTKIANSKFFPKTKRSKPTNKTIKKRRIPKIEKGVKRKTKSDSDDNMDASHHEEKWHKPGKTPKGFKYGKSSFSSSIPNAAVNIDVESPKNSNPRTPETDFSESPVKLYIPDEDFSNVDSEREQIIKAAKNVKLTFYEKSHLVSTANYYDINHHHFVRCANYATYEWTSYRDMMSLINENEQLTDVAMYCALDLFIKLNHLHYDYIVYITNPLTSLFNGNLTETEKERLMNVNQWVPELFVDPKLVHVCPFLISATDYHTNHWVLAIIDFKEKVFHFFDSLNYCNGKTYFNNFLTYMNNNKEKFSHFSNQWTFKQHKTTLQKGITCGKHVLGFCRRYMFSSKQTINDRTFMNVNSLFEGLRFAELIFENATSTKNLCVKCHKELLGNDEEFKCIMCEYSIHNQLKCMSSFDIITDEIYICPTCVSYLKKQL